MTMSIGRRAARCAALTGLLSVTALGTVGLAPAAAGLPVGSALDGSSSMRIAGLPGGWTLSLYAFDGGGPSDSVGLTIRKRNAAKTAWSEDQWRTTGGIVSCGAKLGTCTVDDDGNLGTYGRVRLSFAATRPLTHRDLVCNGSDVVYATQQRRAGKLSGTLRLASKSKLIGTIRNGAGAHRVPASIPITMKRTTYTGGVCPDVSACDEAAVLNADGYSVTGYRRLPTGRGSTGFVRQVASAEPSVERTWYVTTDGPGASALTVNTPTTLTGATLGMTLSAPFVTGTAVFDATGAKTADTFLGCPAETRDGELDVNLTWHIPGRAKVHQVTTLVGRLIHVPG